MKKFDKELSKTFTDVLKEFLNCSEREMENSVREEIKTFLKKETLFKKHTPEEVYDFCDYISKKPCKKICEEICVGDISSFMQSTFDVTKYYEK